MPATAGVTRLGMPGESRQALSRYAPGMPGNNFRMSENHADIEDDFDSVYRTGAYTGQDDPVVENGLSPIVDSKGWREIIFCPIFLPGFNKQTGVLGKPSKPCGE